MAFYDFHVHTNISIGEDTPVDVIEMSKRLGLNGIGLVRYENREFDKFSDFDVVNAIIIKPQTPEELEKMVSKFRNKAEILMVHGGDYDVNRAACENSAIDVLCHPELNRTDSGLDHICVKAASEKDVAIEINFREILESYKRQRVNVISFIKKNIELCKKYNTKMITVSGAVSKWGLRSPRELAANAHVLGLDLGAAIASVSVVPEQILEKNREKITGRRWEGVKLVDE